MKELAPKGEWGGRAVVIQKGSERSKGRQKGTDRKLRSSRRHGLRVTDSTKKHAEGN